MSQLLLKLLYIVTAFVTRGKSFMTLATCGKVFNILVTNITIADKLTLLLSQY
jgi:hypothetical protein